MKKGRRKVQYSLRVRPRIGDKQLTDCRAAENSVSMRWIVEWLGNHMIATEMLVIIWISYQSGPGEDTCGTCDLSKGAASISVIAEL